MALTQPNILSLAVMLEEVPTLTGILGIKTVPVTFIGSTRVDGPLSEWVLAQRVTGSPQDG